MGKTKGKFRKKLLQITVGPLLFLGIVITLITYISFTITMQKEVQRGLQNIAVVTQRMLDHLYVGDYYLEQEDGKNYIYKGQNNLTGKDFILEEIRQDTGIDITLFLGNIRVLTTLKGEDGTDLTGTTAHPDVVEDVLKNKKEMFYRNASVSGKSYFAYYMPLYNGDGTCVGMVFAGKPTDVVNSEILQALGPILLLLLLVSIVSCIVCCVFTQRVVADITGMKVFLKEIAQGNLKAELAPDIMKRNDELGEMGIFITHVQKFLQEMVERDMLTKLYSRRIGEIKLKQVQAEAAKKGSSFVVAIGDIDFFKRFNDTYGHDCGDRVLKEIAALISRHMKEKGFAVRWGGEEILIIYENASLQEAAADLETLRKEIIEYRLQYNEKSLSITMTFGLAAGKNDCPITQIIKRADALLYKGKMNGKNQIEAETEV